MVAEAIKGVLRHNDLQVLLMAAQDNRNNAQKRYKLHQIETVIPARHRVIIKAAHPDKGQVRSRHHLIEATNRGRGPAPGKAARLTEHKVGILIEKLIPTEAETIIMAETRQQETEIPVATEEILL